MLQIKTCPLRFDLAGDVMQIKTPLMRTKDYKQGCIKKTLTLSVAFSFDDWFTVGEPVLKSIDEVAIAFGSVEVGVISVVATTFVVSVSKYDVTQSVRRLTINRNTDKNKKKEKIFFSVSQPFLFAQIVHSVCKWVEGWGRPLSSC